MPARPAVSEPACEPLEPGSLGRVLVGGALLLGVGVWAYWSTLAEIVATWNREPDYSHGWLVVPLAAMFVWLRMDSFPGIAKRMAWSGLSLIGLSAAWRLASGWLYIEAIDGWSILPWVGGSIWMLAGWKVFRWSLPSVGFLFFMIPWPFGLEHSLSFPLRTVATKMSCWVLQFLGQPAIAEGHVIMVGDHYMEIEEACSGLRIFVGVFALAFACLIVFRRSWWERMLILAAVVPVALIANSTRIVVTGLLHLHFSSEAAQKFSHDLAGLAMIPYAGGLFLLVLYYTSRLMRQEPSERSRAAAPISA